MTAAELRARAAALEAEARALREKADVKVRENPPAVATPPFLLRAAALLAGVPGGLSTENGLRLGRALRARVDAERARAERDKKR